MSETEQEIINAVINKTDSVMILFFVLFIIGMVAAFIPIYRMQLKDRKELREYDKERQEIYVKVVTANTEAMVGIKTLMEANISDTKEGLRRIHMRIDDLIKDMVKWGADG